MVQSGEPCESSVPETKAEKLWPYEQYYIGEKDKEKRRHGYGENHWSGGESLECYNGSFSRDTMHGVGEYRWRFLGPAGLFLTYEGYFYANAMHGYGTMSYPDGRIFNGLFQSNIRWGPGIETYACLRENVGLWRGTQLVRLCWRPSSLSVAPDFASASNGRTLVKSHRIMLTTCKKNIGEVNSALELLKKFGVDPRIAAEKWNKLYPKYCTDLSSGLCHVDVFDHNYYKEKIYSLEEVESVPKNKEDGTVQNSDNDLEDTGTYYAWNNNDIMILMMKHCYKHEKQRSKAGIDLNAILSGSRKSFKTAGHHELDCRTLLMASYLGHIANVVQLVNESNVHPDVADVQGNNTVMYAACGDQVDLIHFLVEAGGNVDSYNDSCCTPLAVALLRFICVKKDISANGMIQALIPPLIVPTLSMQNVFEWNIARELEIDSSPAMLTKQVSRIARNSSMKVTRSMKSLQAVKDMQTSKRKMDTILEKATEIPNEGDQFTEDKRLYYNIYQEYSIRINDLFGLPSAVTPIPYVFEVHDMVQEIEGSNEDEKKLPDKNPKKVVSKTLKNASKPSKEVMWQNNENDDLASIDSAEKEKIQRLTKIMMTICQLLSDGAKPKSVQFPQPALATAIISGSPELVRHLIHHGADVNEIYNQIQYYMPIDLAVSRSLNSDTLEIIRALLEGGSNVNHRLQCRQSRSDSDISETPGPTLLHAVLAKKTNSEFEEEIRQQILENLLQFNCNPTIQFKGQSAIDVAMEKNRNLLDIFIKSPRTYLNAIINESNQSILIKMFSIPFYKSIDITERLQILTNLLLFGADPHIECQNEDEKYQNIFVFARKNLLELENPKSMPAPSASKPNPKGKKDDKKKDDKLAVRSIGKMSLDDLDNYKQAVDLVTECARLLHIRWLQAKLMKEIVQVVDKFKHRQWSMILKECKHKKVVSLWLTAQRCLEMWEILKTTKKKVYNNHKVLKYLLFIVQYCNYSSGKTNKPMTVQDKDMIEAIVNQLLREQHSLTYSEKMPWKKPYVKPELSRKTEKKFNVCFECALPLKNIEEKMICSFCKMISFCSIECIHMNVNKPNCHPCRNYMMQKYNISPDTCSEVN